MSVRHDDVRRRLRGLHAVGPPLVVQVGLGLDPFHLYSGLGPVLVLLLVAERAEGGRGTRLRVRGYAVHRRAALRVVLVREEEALPGLARAVAHLQWRAVAVLDVDVAVGAEAVLAPDEYGQDVAAGHVARGVGDDGVRGGEAVGVRGVGAVRMGAAHAGVLLLQLFLLAQLVELLLPTLTDMFLRGRFILKTFSTFLLN